MKSRKILIIGDEASAGELARNLAEIGFEVTVQAADPDTVLEPVELPQADLALIDLGSAGSLTTVSDAQTLQERLGMPLLFLTPPEEESFKTLADESGLFGYVEKPFTLPELKAALKMALDRHQIESRLHNQQELISAIIETTKDAFWLTDMEGRFIDVNDACSRLTGYTRGELLGMSIFDLEADETPAEIREQIRKIQQSGFASFERRQRCKDGRLIHVDVSVNYLSVAGGRLFCFLHDITDRKRIEEERTVTLELLEMANSAGHLQELMQSATSLLRNWSGCDAVGIRLQQEEDYPYYLTHGLPSEFVLAENFLCEKDPAGRVERDSAGNPVLECMCGNVLCGRFDPGKPFFTKHGSFWTNSTTELLASTSESDRMARTRNRCQGEGYESVALIPLRVTGKTYGLIQLNDKRAGRFSPERIAQLERLGDSLALALAHRIDQSELIQNEAELIAIYDSVPIVMLLMDQDSRILRANRAAARFIGLPESQLQGSRCGDFLCCIHVPDDPRGCGFGPACPHCPLFQAMRDTIRDGNNHDIIEAQVNVRRGAEVRQIWINASTARLEIEGQPRLLFCLQDVTEQKEAVLKIAEQAALLDVSHDSILVCDFEGRIRYMNRAAEEMTGWSYEDARKEAAERVLNSVSDQQLKRVVEESVASGAWSGELTLLTKEGLQVIVDSRWTLVRDPQESPKYLLIVNTDITAKKQLENQYLRAQRLESLGILASGVAHDLNNVLSPLLIGGFVLKSALTDETSQSVLESMMDAVRRGTDTVKQLLTFARGGDGEKVAVQPRHMFQEISRLLRQTLPKNIQVYTDFAPNQSSLMANPSQLHQVLMNLCVNARDAMSNGGVLSITAENTLLDERSIKLHPKAVEGAYVLIKVSDTGSGVPPEMLDRIFDPFFTTKPQGLGTGLGLATVLGIVENHGGFILVESQLGKGTVFSIYLPAIPPGTETVRPEIDLLSLDGHGELVLVVDDEQGICKLVHGLLKRHGYEALTAGSAVEALELYQKHGEKIRVVLTDMMMPFLDGMGLITRLRALSSDLIIMAFSGLSTKSKAEEVLSSGANAFLHKPVDVVQLLTALRDLLKEKGAPAKS